MMTGESLGLLRAGALTPVDEPLVEGEPTDTISARSYAHAALGDRAVVRLVPDTIARAEDLALEFLGLSLTEATPPLARGRRQALGFPGWALVNDPASGSYALAIVKDIERLSRLARSKPGNAKDGFEQLAEQLTRSVPHFLPTFYEQAGRAFIEASNTAQAAAMFNRARESERVYGLTVDEDRRRQVFLEFALAAALTSRALEDYADQLAEAHPAAEAYAVFRELCVQRTLGGVPPWSGMATRLQQMARAANLEPAHEAEQVLQALLEAPATRLAGAGFWKTARQPLVSLARQQPRVRGLLLNLFPMPQSGSDGFADWWLELLDACGALEALTAPPGSAPAEAEPTGGPAAWLERTLVSSQRSWLSRPCAKLVALLPRLAPRLRELGVPVDLIGRWGWRADLGLIDAALELEIPVAPPQASLSMTLQPPAYGRNLEHIVKHPEWRPALHNAFDTLLQNQRDTLDQLLAVSGVQHLFADWLDGRADALERGALPLAAAVFPQLKRAESERSLSLNPRARARIDSTDLGALLARTLRGGLLDEFGWPALEEAWAKFRPGPVTVGYAWPNLILRNASRALVVGPSGILLEHDFRAPPQAYGPTDVLYAGAQLLVLWRRTDTACGYWSGRPGNVFDLKETRYAGWQPGFEASWELADGSRTAGGRALHPGDTSVAEAAHMFTDGTTFWQVVFDRPANSRAMFDAPGARLREYDPTTGRAGAASLPPFLREFDRADRPLLLDLCWLMPLVPGLEQTPLGTAGGLLGWRVRSTGSSAAPLLDGEGIDGRSFSGSPGVRRFAGASHLRTQPMAAGLVSVPGDEAHPRPLEVAGGLVSLWSPDGSFAVFQGSVGANAPQLARGTPVVLPPLYWHNLRPRDAAGSRALRAVSDAACQQLLESATRELGDSPPDAQETPSTDGLIRTLLPDVSDARLLSGISGAVREASRLESQRPARGQQAIRRETAEEPALTDQDLREALQGFLSRGQGWSPASPSPTVAQLQAVAAVMRGEPMPKSVPGSALPWPELVGYMGAVAFRAVVGPTTPTQRGTLLRLLDIWADTPFAEVPSETPPSRGWRQTFGKLRGRRSAGQRIRVAEVRDITPRSAVGRSDPSLLRSGAHVWLIGELGYTARGEYGRWLVEASPDGSFSVPREFALVADRPINLAWDAAKRLRGVAALVRERGPLPWLPERVTELAAATGLPRPEATLLLAGLPGMASPAHNFLDKDLRELFGLKVAEAAAAKETFSAVPTLTRLAVLAGAMPEDPTRLWDSEALVEGLAAAWLERFPRRASVPDQLIVQVRSALKTPVEAATLLSACADPTADPRLNRDGSWVVESRAGGLARRADDGQPVFDGAMLLSVAQLLPWLFAALPVGDPLRSNWPSVLERVRKRLDNRELLADIGFLTIELQTLDLLGGGPYQPPGGAAMRASRDVGALIAVAVEPTVPIWWRGFLRPALVSGSEDAALVQLASDGSAYHATRFLRGPGATAMAERVERTPVPPGGYEANPLLSAPPLVDEVAAHLSLERDAAAAYLQVLALAEPIARNLSTWNAWPAARVATAFDTLIDRNLLMRATRQRAGRDAFLPGAWEDLKAPNLPLERWKLALYEHAPLSGRVLPLHPLHELFATAWQHVRAGAGPAFEPVPPARRAR